MFLLPSKWKHVVVGRTTASVEVERKNIADVDCKFLRQHRTKKIFYLKKILSANVCKRNCAMSAEKYQLGLYTDQCRQLYFLCNPWIIFGWCLIGNVRSASSGDASFLNLHRWSFLIQRQLAFFPISIGESSFFPRWANTVVAEQLKTCRCRSNHNFNWGQTKKPSRRRL